MCSHYIVMHNSILFSMYQVLPSGHRSTLIQRWASTFLNHRQRWYLVEKSLILKQLSTKNQLLNHNSTKNQPSLKLKCQWWKMVEIWLTVGWFLVKLWLRSWFLVDHCFKINNFLYTTHAIAQYFLPTIFWVLVIRISNTMFMLVVKEGVMVKKVGKESTLFCLDSFKSHSTLNISYANQFNYWPSPTTKKRLCLYHEHYRTPLANPPQKMVVSGCSVAVWHSVNSLPGCVYTGHSNRKDPKTHGNH